MLMLGIALIALVLPGPRSISFHVAMPSDQQGRITRRLASDWRFHLGDIPDGQQVALDDRTWEPISVPYAYGGPGHTADTRFYHGPAWYRRSLEIGPELAGKRLYLRFGAAALSAQVYLNGRRVGEHLGGFSAFCFDATPFLNKGSNVIAVRTDNSTREDMMPLSGDLNIYGGLYRDVTLLALNPVCISPTDEAGPGVYAVGHVNGGSAKADVRTVVENHGTGEAWVTLECSLIDATSHAVSRATVERTLGPGAHETVSAELPLAHPHLWDGVRNPYLYKVDVVVTQGRKVMDRVSQPLGFRSYRVDPEKGLILNGRRYDYHGVDLHQGRPGVGWASTPEMVKQDYALVQELGATGVRMAHYQHGDAEYEACDGAGLVVWSEIPLMNKMTNSPAFKANAKQQLREMIKQEFNHPSVLFWSLYNEPWIDKVKGPDEWTFVKELVSLGHELDPNRLTTGGSVWSGNADFDWYMDVTAFNRYWGWYTGEASEWPAGIAKLRSEAQGRSFGISEYGAGASVTQHEIPPKHPVPNGKFHPEEWQAEVHEQIWPYLAAQDWMWCKLVWVMFDVPASGHNEGATPDLNDKGLVTADRTIRKDAFYYYKAQWSKKPFVYITSRRYNPRPSGVWPVKVYSNCQEVELFQDGRSLGVKQSTTGVFIWPKVEFGPGRVEIKAAAHGTGSPVGDSVTWANE